MTVDVTIGDSCYFGGNALACAIDQLVGAFGGEALFGLIAGSLLFGVFYVAAGGSMATPTVALILTGTVIIPMLPGSYSQMATAVVLIGLAAALWQVVQKYVFSGVVR